MILRLEELEFLLDTVQSFQDCKLERLARLQGDLRGKKRKRIRERQDEKQILRCVCACMFACVHVRACAHLLKNRDCTHCACNVFV